MILNERIIELRATYLRCLILIEQQVTGNEHHFDKHYNE
jgi:hypothetical protein